MLKILSILYRTWFTGAIFCLAVAGYIFYSFLLVLRIVQRSKHIIIISALLLLLLSLGTVQLFIPFHKKGNIKNIFVDKGVPVSYVAKVLKKERVIPSVNAFLLWIKLKKIEKNVQAGHHVFYEYEGVISAAEKLLSAKAIDLIITVPEGLTINQTACRLAEASKIDTSDFIRLCRDSVFIAKLGYNTPTLEGYLFPDTYNFSPESGAEDIIERMTSRFQNVYQNIKETPIKQKFSRHEIVTLASIIEKEAMLAEEREHISGVFHNRLKRKWPLGADPTVRYALNKFSGPLRVSELKNPSPYNTRIHSGLPPGPICSPGKSSLTAAILPKETKDLYFVAKWDGSGAHVFSETNAEHDRNKMEIRKKNEQLKRIKRREKSSEK